MGDDAGSGEDGGSGGAVPLDVVPLHSTNLLTVLDGAGVVRYESPAIERILGFDQAALVGEPVADYFHPEDRDRVVDAFRRVVASDDYLVESVEYRHERTDGSYLWVESVASADPTPDGNYVVNTRDVSARRARERALERSNARLDEFASVVSHDLRNPLNVAQGRLQQARADCDSEYLDEVARAQSRMAGLIDDLLTLARTGAADPELSTVDLEAVGEDCWRAVETGDVRLVVAVKRPIRADPARLRQLLENLFRNAVQHGRGTATVTIGPLDDRSGFFVADDGSGVDDDARPRVFEGGYSTLEEGTGLGLKIVADVAEAHGWTLELTDSPEGGARFEIAGVEFR